MAGSLRKPPLGKLALVQRNRLGLVGPLVVGKLVVEHIVLGELERIELALGTVEQRILRLEPRKLALGRLATASVELGPSTLVVAALGLASHTAEQVTDKLGLVAALFVVEQSAIALEPTVGPLVLVEPVSKRLVSLGQSAGRLSMAAEPGQIFESWFGVVRSSAVFGSKLVIDLGMVLWMLSQLERRFSAVGQPQ